MAGSAKSGRPRAEQTEVLGSKTPPKKPNDLSGDYASACWDKAIEQMGHCIREVDGPLLRLACEAYQRSMDLRDDGDDNGARKESQVYLQLAKELGLTPSSRRVVKPPAGKAFESTPFDNWLTKRGNLGVDKN